MHIWSFSLCNNDSSIFTNKIFIDLTCFFYFRKGIPFKQYWSFREQLYMHNDVKPKPELFPYGKYEVDDL